MSVTPISPRNLRNDPDNLPGYEIEHVIGQGGMATVFLATQVSLQRKVALKVLTDPQTPEFAQRFVNEAHCIAAVDHTNVISIYDVGQSDEHYFLSMEYLPGGDMKARMAEGLETAQVYEILVQLSKCLDFMHGKGIVHRDLKPSNILFRNDGTPVLTDFGIAKLIQQDNDLTVTGTVMGSPYYFSPEQAHGASDLDGRADFYSLGIIFYELLTGERPFRGDSFAGTIIAHLENDIPVLPLQHASLQPLIDRMLAKRPEDRVQNGQEVIDMLRMLIGGQQGDTPGFTLEQEQTQFVEPDSEQDSEHGPTPLPRWKLGAALLGVTALAAWAAVQLFQPADHGVPPENPSALIPDDARPVDKHDFVPELPPAETPNGTDTDMPRAEAQELLEKARQAADDYRLTTPPGANALAYYRQVLEQEPDNGEALQGIQGIATRYTWLAQQQIEQQNTDKARQYVDLGLQIAPQHSRLLAIRAGLSEAAPTEETPPAAETEPPAKPPSTNDEAESDYIRDIFN